MSTRLTGLVKVDSKGRITIPQTIRESLGIEAGMLVAMLADTEKKEIIVSPIMAENAKVIQIEVTMQDRPGALAKVTSKLSELKVDIIANRCTSITRREEGECTFIVDISQSTTDVEGIRKALEGLDVVTQVMIRQFEPPVF
ncbi:MAG: ACT domain-containing protein [Acidilobus sp.]|jgi:AbrB family looped-hinge helix DNA binding protein|nr:ACT domain-containing protein [Acidilobus sp.]MCG2889422.1 ACT domain-containing protein [Acidilobus sp.]MCG2890902.1 ACT domain-containing protein [Acidilobus sp.]NAZ31472.1 ACT domain-containing protein [Acidilobus sp.]